MSDVRIVGQVAVKVIPDTRGFRREAEKEVKRHTAGIEADIELHADGGNLRREAKAEAKKAGKAAAVEIPVNLDNRESIMAAMRRLRRELQKLGEKPISVKLHKEAIEKEIGNLEKSLGRTSLDLTVDKFDPDSIRKAMRELDKEIERHKTPDLKVNLDHKSLADARAKLENDLAKRVAIETELAHRPLREAALNAKREFEKIDFKIVPRADEKEIARDLTKLKRRIRDTIYDIEETKLRLQTELDPLKKERVKEELEDLTEDLKAMVGVEIEALSHRTSQARLAWLSRMRIVQLVPVVNRAAARTVAHTLNRLSGLRLVDKYMRDFWDKLANLDKNVPAISAIGLGITNIGAGALAASSNLFALSASLAQMAQASLALPGILGGLAIGLGATIAVLKDFNKQLPEVKDMFSDLQDQMSERFWRRAKAPIRDMINNLFPELRRGILGTSDALGDFFANLAHSGTRQLRGRLIPMFDNLNKSIRIAARYTDHFVGIIEKLGTVGSEYLPRLARWFGTLSKRFDQWLGKNKNNGQLYEWIEHGIFELKEFGRWLRATGRVLRGLARAAEKAGGSTLTKAADTMEQIDKVVNGSKFQTGFTRALMAAHKAMENISQRSGPQFKRFMDQLSFVMGNVLPQAGDTLGRALGAIFSALSQASVTTGVLRLFQGIDNLVRSLEPSMPVVGDALGALMEVLGTAASTLGPILSEAFEIVSRWVTDLKPVVEDIIEKVGGKLGEVLGKVSPELKKLSKIIADFYWNNEEGFGKLIDAVGRLVELITPAAVYVIEDFTRAIEDLKKALGFGDGEGGGSGIVGKIALLLSSLWLLNKALKPIKSLLGWLKKLQTLFAALGGAVSGAGTSIQKFGNLGKFVKVTGWVTGIMTLVEWVNKLPEAFDRFKERVDKINRWQEEAEGWGEEIWRGFVAGLGRFGATIIAPFEAFIEAVKSLFGIHSPSTVFIEIGKNIILGFINGVTAVPGLIAGAITTAFSGAISTAKNLARRIAAGARAALSAGWEKLTTTGSKVKSAISKAVSGGTKAAREKASQIGTSVKSTLNNAWDRLKDGGSKVGTSVGRAVKSGTEPARRGASEVGQKAKSALSKAWDRLKSLVSGDWGKVAPAIKNVARPAESAGKTVGSKAKSGLQSGSGGARSVGEDVLRGFLSGLGNGGLLAAISSAAASIGRRALAAAKAALKSKSPSKKFIELGLDSGAGLRIGLTRSRRSVERASRDMAASVERASRSELQIHSPSKKFVKIGKEILRGLEKGLKDANGKKAVKVINKALKQAQDLAAKARTKSDQAYAKNLPRLISQTAERISKEAEKQAAAFRKAGKKVGQGFVQGLVGTLASVNTQIGKLNTQIGQLEAKARTKQQKQQVKAIQKLVQTAKKELQALAKEWERVNSQIEQTKALMDQVKGQFLDFADFTQLPSSFADDIVDYLSGVAAQTTQFFEVIEQLRRAGLNKDALEDLIMAGPNALDQALGILEGGASVIKDINKFYAQIGAAGENTGESLATAMFDAGRETSKGFLEGLKKDRAKIVKEMKAIGKALVKAIRKELGIKSPSRAMIAVGRFVMQGLGKGLRANTEAALSAMTDMGAALQEKGASAVDGLVAGMNGRRSALRDAIARLESEYDKSSLASASQLGAVNTGDLNESVVVKQLNYYAAEGPSLSAEEQLFQAAQRARMVF